MPWTPPFAYGPGKPKPPHKGTCWSGCSCADVAVATVAAKPSAPTWPTWFAKPRGPLEYWATCTYTAGPPPLMLPPAKDDVLYWPMATTPKKSPEEIMVSFFAHYQKSPEYAAKLVEYADALHHALVFGNGSAVEVSQPKHFATLDQLQEAGGWKIPTSAPTDYEKVGRALGFTLPEIQALVHCNDFGCSFSEIADLIDTHPVVYSSARTANRIREERDFIAACERARRNRPRVLGNTSMAFISAEEINTFVGEPYQHDDKVAALNLAVANAKYSAAWLEASVSITIPAESAAS